MENKQKVLIVDDTPDNIRLAADTLKDLDVSISFATNGFKAIEILEEQDMDLILMDINMPGMDGFETVEKLKTNVPVIFLTALDDKESIVKAFRVGGVDYVSKPFHPEELIARVTTHLSIKKYKDEIETKNIELSKTVRVLENKLSRVAPPKKEKNLGKLVGSELPTENDDSIKGYFFDDHQGDLNDLIEELDSQINLIILKDEVSVERINSVGELFARYGRILNMYPILYNLGRKMEDFAESLKNTKCSCSEYNYSYALGCMESLIFSLTHWHNQVFAHKLEDPSIYENSFLSDMETIEYALEDKLNEIEGDVDFF